MASSPSTPVTPVIQALAAPPLSNDPRPESSPSVKFEPPPSDPSATATPAVVRTPEPAPPLPALTITIPSCSSWFSWDEIHETEKKLLPGFFDDKSPSKNPRVYKYYRDSIMSRFRANPSRRISFTEARKSIVGDVGSVRKVFDFLESWGLINYTPPQVKHVGKERKVGGDEGVEKREILKKVCSSCNSVCSLACFATDKLPDVILCAKCYVSRNYRPGLSSTEFRRVDITEETKTEWTDKETLHLLEAVLQYGEDWKKVSEHVSSRTEKECVARFIKLPFGEQFLGPPESGKDEVHNQKQDQISKSEQLYVSKRQRLTPLADTSNPIMAQVAFLSAMVGSEVSAAVAKTAVAALSEVERALDDSLDGSIAGSAGIDKENEDVHDEGTPLEAKAWKKAISEARSQLEEEHKNAEKSISNVIDVQMKEMEGKMAKFEELEARMEEERLQLRYIGDLLLADQLELRLHRPSPRSLEME